MSPPSKIPQSLTVRQLHMPRLIHPDRILEKPTLRVLH